MASHVSLTRIVQKVLHGEPVKAKAIIQTRRDHLLSMVMLLDERDVEDADRLVNGIALIRFKKEKPDQFQALQEFRQAEAAEAGAEA